MTEPTRRNRSMREDEDVGRRQNYRRLAENRIRVQEILQGAIIEEPIAALNMED